MADVHANSSIIGESKIQHDVGFLNRAFLRACLVAKYEYLPMAQELQETLLPVVSRDVQEQPDFRCLDNCLYETTVFVRPIDKASLLKYKRKMRSQ